MFVFFRSLRLFRQLCQHIGKLSGHEIWIIWIMDINKYYSSNSLYFQHLWQQAHLVGCFWHILLFPMKKTAAHMMVLMHDFSVLGYGRRIRDWNHWPRGSWTMALATESQLPRFLDLAKTTTEKKNVRSVCFFPWYPNLKIQNYSGCSVTLFILTLLPLLPPTMLTASWSKGFPATFSG